MTSMLTTPAAFLGHGNPMNALSHNAYTDAWRQFGRACGKPRAVLMVSAHWYTNASAVTAMPYPRTIHDFYGFPRQLSEFQYPAPGSPELAEEVADLARPDQIGLDAESWGLDHGTWSVLAHAFPDSDVPVVQLSINALQPFDYHMELAARLAPLRSSGVAIVGSGNLVHNLHRIDWVLPDEGYTWASEFDAYVRETMANSPGELVAAASTPNYQLAHPTPDHFIPLLYIAALADRSVGSTEVLVEGLMYGSISMTALALDMPPREFSEPETASAHTRPPHPDTMPASQSNM